MRDDLTKEPETQILRLKEPATICIVRLDRVNELRLSTGDGGQLIFELTPGQLRLLATQTVDAVCRMDESR